MYLRGFFIFFLSLINTNYIVVDFCLVKELTLDKMTNYQSLKLQWASKASLTQRKGRAGRVSEGRCYRLITQQFYNKLNSFSDPEIKVNCMGENTLAVI